MEQGVTPLAYDEHTILCNGLPNDLMNTENPKQGQLSSGVIVGGSTCRLKPETAQPNGKFSARIGAELKRLKTLERKQQL